VKNVSPTSLLHEKPWLILHWQPNSQTEPWLREPAPPGQASAKTHSAETHDALKHWALLGWQADCVGHRLFAQKVSGVHASTAAQS
jgi:hypothetical protein